jgi:hypothetical protein
MQYSAPHDAIGLLELFCSVDDFTKANPELAPSKALSNTIKHRNRQLSMALSEIMTINILFHMSHYRNFKHFYIDHVCKYLSADFPNLPSYNRFVEWIPRVAVPLSAYLFSKMGACSGISFIDSTALAVCHNKRIQAHKTFSGSAARGKTSVDWFFGFKLHLVFNDAGELINLLLSPGNMDDRKALRQMLPNPFNLTGYLYGDKGYISKDLKAELEKDHGIFLITKQRKNAKNPQILTEEQKFLLGSRGIVETIIDQLKNISQIEHTRHRSYNNFRVNLICGLIAYSLQPNKPNLKLVSRYMT